MNGTREVGLFGVWYRSRQCLITSRRERQELTATQYTLSRERRPLKQSARRKVLPDSEQTRLNFLTIRVRESGESLKAISQRIKTQARDHQALCERINLELGPGTIRGWLRAMRTRTRHLAYLPSPPAYVASAIEHVIHRELIDQPTEHLGTQTRENPNCLLVTDSPPPLCCEVRPEDLMGPISQPV